MKAQEKGGNAGGEAEQLSSKSQVDSGSHGLKVGRRMAQLRN